MSQSQPHPEWNQTHDTTVVETTPREKNASMALLWLIALIAVAAAGLAWYKTQQANEVPLAATPPAVTTPVDETLPSAKNEAARADERRAAATDRRSAAATPRTLAPRPLASNPTPRYPSEALRAGVGGTVLVRVVVDANGVPTDATVVDRSGNRELDRAALSAVRKWRFEPAMRNGRAVSSTVQVPVDFKPI